MKQKPQPKFKIGDTVILNTRTLYNETFGKVTDHTEIYCPVDDRGKFIPRALHYDLTTLPDMRSTYKVIDESTIELTFPDDLVNFHGKKTQIIKFRFYSYSIETPKMMSLYPERALKLFLKKQFMPIPFPPVTKTVIQKTALALLSDGRELKPSDVKNITKSIFPVPVIRTILDDLYEDDLQIRRKIATEGVHVTFVYSRLKELPKGPQFGFIDGLNLSGYDKNLYVAYDSNKRFGAAIFNTTDKYEARNQYKVLVGNTVKHNDVRMTKLEIFLK